MICISISLCCDQTHTKLCFGSIRPTAMQTKMKRSHSLHLMFSDFKTMSGISLNRFTALALITATTAALIGQSPARALSLFSNARIGINYGSRIHLDPYNKRWTEIRSEPTSYEPIFTCQALGCPGNPSQPLFSF